MMHRTAALALVISLVACGGSPAGPGGMLDAQTAVDARDAVLPAWMLEDIQPQSPRVGQTYGLQTFSGKIVVVTLVEGF